MLPDTIEARAEFAMIMQFISRSITKKVLDDDVLEAYWFFLAKKFDTMQEFKETAEKLGSSWLYSYMPNPGHFAEAAQGAEDYELIATKAYSKAKEAAISYGVYHNLEFDDPFIAETTLTLFASWKEFHDHVAYRDSDDTWVKRDFVRTYKSIAKNGRTSGKKLVGYLQEDFTSPIQISCDYESPKVKREERPAIASNVLRALPNKRVQNG